METYKVEIVQYGNVFRVTVTRQSDGVELIAIAPWRWWLKFRTRRGALERAFKSYDKRLKKLAVAESHLR